jgi:hypothetical protein
LTQQIGPRRDQGFVVRAAPQSGLTSCHGIVPDAGFSSEWPAGRCGSAAIFAFFRGRLNALDESAGDQISGAIIRIGHEGHDPFVFDAEGKFNALVGQPQALNAGLGGTVNVDLENRLGFVFGQRQLEAGFGGF